ncbi:HlyD family efflux transporter periplasmic adaptor subunit [Actinoplanes xinjiangensis]|uniref:HlyD family secretion protein n=1 Tax=Actinoplanes xinjiangensis TaxID=512350 RepID=A0A316FDL0_9ACTN|nr:HlyD family efflux transporter periplasmic adaptor subunit [Actinoplanes xinjiangensis]PWK46215.1 HlyD family secretion protein [Actinoplanes xinjiangensis]
MRRRGTTAAVAVALTVGGVAAYLLTGGLPEAEGTGARAAGNQPAATADITRQTLVDKESHGGSLGFGDTASLTTRLSGTVTALPAAGATIRRGGTLYQVDNDPVVLLYGSLPAYRTLSPGDEGTDVTQFEKNLWALGHRGFTVDDEYTPATADAVEDWQDDLGLDETGTVELGRVVYAGGPIRIASRGVDLGATVQPGTELLSTTATGRVAVVELGIDDQRLARKGTRVDVTLPDGKTVPAKITGVVTTVEEAENPGQQDTTAIQVTVGFDKAPQGLDDAAVTVAFVSSRRENVLTVPVNALLALAEGGYGLQIVDGTSTRIVAVETGLFASGRVEVSAEGLAEGWKVGIPT